jgi:hypothetical protein
MEKDFLLRYCEKNTVIVQISSTIFVLAPTSTSRERQKITVLRGNWPHRASAFYQSPPHTTITKIYIGIPSLEQLETFLNHLFLASPGIPVHLVLRPGFYQGLQSETPLFTRRG